MTLLVVNMEDLFKASLSRITGMTFCVPNEIFFKMCGSNLRMQQPPPARESRTEYFIYIYWVSALSNTFNQLFYENSGIPLKSCIICHEDVLFLFHNELTSDTTVLREGNKI